jgi:riboflavin kinase
MSGTSTAPAIGHDELAALKHIALDGGLTGQVKISCAKLADRLEASSQTASRRLQRLEEAGLLDREVVSDGQWVSVTGAGEGALRREYTDYQRIFEADATLSLTGEITSGMGEGRHYIMLDGYVEQFRERLGYVPYPGTLNVELTEESTRKRAGIGALPSVDIDAWEDEERTFGPATCYAVRLENGAKAYEGAHIIVPERTHHEESQLEVIAPDPLREELGLDDGDELQLHVEAV